jgi:hypothetical protein
MLGQFKNGNVDQNQQKCWCIRKMLARCKKQNESVVYSKNAKTNWCGQVKYCFIDLVVRNSFDIWFEYLIWNLYTFSRLCLAPADALPSPFHLICFVFFFFDNYCICVVGSHKLHRSFTRVHLVVRCRLNGGAVLPLCLWKLQRIMIPRGWFW